MARYSALLGRRVDVHYRAGDISLTATGTLAADSGKSIFLEEHFCQRDKVRTFRWEIPYQCIVRLVESAALPPPAEPASPGTADSTVQPADVLRLKDRPWEA